MILRPSCHECRAKQGSSNSDITIADFWGSHIEMPEMDDDKGTGLVLVNTDKGRQALFWSNVSKKESSLVVASKYNGGLSSITKPHPKRSDFFAALDASPSVIDLIDKSLRPSFKHRVRLALRRYKQQIKKILKKLIGGKYSLAHQNLPCTQISQSDYVPPIPQDTKISAITFRNKYNGWKSYRMEIILK